MISYSEVPVPLLCCTLGWLLPAFDPGDVSTEGATEVARGLVDRESMHGCPQLQLVSVALAFVAVLSSGLQVDGQRATASGCRAVNGTGSMQLISGLTRRHEAELVQYVLHRDFVAQRIEVDARHASPRFSRAFSSVAPNREEALVLVFALSARMAWCRTAEAPFECQCD